MCVCEKEERRKLEGIDLWHIQIPRNQKWKLNFVKWQQNSDTIKNWVKQKKFTYQRFAVVVVVQNFNLIINYDFNS